MTDWTLVAQSLSLAGNIRYGGREEPKTPPAFLSFNFFPLIFSFFLGHLRCLLRSPHYQSSLSGPSLSYKLFCARMRGVQIFTGTSHPALAETVCERLGAVPAQADLGKFANGETRVNINVSIRNQDVYILQSGSSKINDSVMELLIMISACKGGSARSITGMFSSFFLSSLLWDSS